LMDVKIALAMEIKAYRILLDNEERRVGLAARPPSGASEKNGSDRPAVTPKVSTVDRTALIGISRVDMDRQFLVVRNSTTDPVLLDGWALRSRDAKAEFMFPSLMLQPGNSVVVWLGGASSTSNASRTLADHQLTCPLPVDRMFAPNGDVSLLANAEGIVVSRHEVMPVL